MLVQAHSEDYVSQLEVKCRESKAARLQEGRTALGWIGFLDSGDTYMTTETYDVCLRATAMWIKAVDHVLAQSHHIEYEQETVPSMLMSSQHRTTRIESGMVLSRPPGHHATRSLSNGFCLFNFCAAATIHASEVLGKRKRDTQQSSYTSAAAAPKISIIDWEVHYGQGTADIVQELPNVRYVSIHQVPAFPYEGDVQEVTGAPCNNILTIPIDAGTTWENGYREKYENVALPFACSASTSASGGSDDDDEQWIPDIILISAGYDGLESDELASVSLGPVDYGRMLTSLHRHLQAHIPASTGGRRMPAIVVGLEGGYQVVSSSSGENTLQHAVLETVKSLLHAAT
jgi:acetoin utilization deacetylase AcuC-like enzyme